MADYTKWRNGTISARVETNKKYMILRMGSSLVSTAGMAWYINFTVYAMREAIDNGYIPVVDWESCVLPQYVYTKEKMNAWELFFEQPCGVGVEEAYGSGSYYVVDDVRKIASKAYDVQDCGNFKALNEWRVFFQKNVRFNRDMSKEIEELTNKLIDEKTVGILLRGTDYTELKPMNHPINMALDEMLTEIDKCVSYDGYEKIFLATEDSAILSKLKKKYGEKLCFLPAPRYEKVGKVSLNLKHLGDVNGYYRDKQYLLALGVLSKCPAMLLAPCGGSIIAAMLHGDTISKYRFYYRGRYKPKAYIIGSALEMQKNEVVYINGRPLIYYALNLLFLLGVEDITFVTSKTVWNALADVRNSLQEREIHLRFLKCEDGSFVQNIYLNDGESIRDSGVCVISEDTILHGANLVSELNSKLPKFDGAYVWGMQKQVPVSTEKIGLNKNKMPEQVLTNENFEGDCRSIIDFYLFDSSFYEILNEIYKHSKKITMSAVLDQYLQSEKLIYSELWRGVMALKVDTEEMVSRTSSVIHLLEEQSGQTIGDALQTAGRLQQDKDRRVL